MRQPETFGVTGGSGKYRLSALIAPTGADWVVVITGGDQPHVGAVAAACSTPGVNQPEHTAYSASVITLPGHKEDEIARHTALALAKALGGNVVVSAGMHWDNITPQGIQAVLKNSELLTQAVIAAVKANLPINMENFDAKS